MKFSEMPYARPDAEAVKAKFTELTERLKNAASYDEARSQWLTEVGQYVFRIGASSRDIRQTVKANIKEYTEKTTDALKTAQ